MKKVVFSGFLLCFAISTVPAPASAQFFKNLQKKLEDKLEKKADETVDQALDPDAPAAAASQEPAKSGKAAKASPAFAASTTKFQAGKFLRFVAHYDALVSSCIGMRDETYRAAASEVLAARNSDFYIKGMQNYDLNFERFFKSDESLSDKNHSSACSSESLDKLYQSNISRYADLHPRFKTA